MSFDQYPQGGRSGNGNGHRSGNGTHRADAEDRAWQQLYARVHNPCIAAELLEYFQGDPEAKRANLGLFMLAKETVRAHVLARDRQERIGHFVRTALDKLFIGPFRFMKMVCTASRNVAVEMLPPMPRTPFAGSDRAAKRVKDLATRREFARELDDFLDDPGGAMERPEQAAAGSEASGDVQKTA